MLARDLMTAHPAMITAGDTVMNAARVMRARDVGMLPVVDDLVHRRLVGVVTDRDLVVRCLAHGHALSEIVKHYMSTAPLLTVAPTAAIKEIADEMMRYQVRRLPVLDTGGAVVGVIAQADLARHIGPSDARLIEQLLEGISQPAARPT